MNILIYGGHSPIALANARHFAESGKRVGLVSSRIDHDLKAALEGTKVFLFENDLSVVGKETLALEQFGQQFGPVEALIFYQKVREASANLSSRFQVEVISTFAIVGAAANSSSGNLKSVVVATSPAATKVLINQPFGYHATKAALSAFVRWSAVEYGPLGVRVNGISPSSVIYKERARDYYLENPGLVKRLNNPVPLRRMGNTREISEVVGFLVSARASFVTGQIIDIDGGVGNLDWHGLVS